MIYKRKIIIPLIVIIFLLSVFSAYFLGKNDYCGSTFDFINLDFSCGKEQIVSKKGYASLKQKIIEYTNKKKKENKLGNISIYFRDLQYGPTLGIEEHAKFAPASLLKLPLLITYLSLAEGDPKILSTQIRYEGTNIPIDEFDQFFKPRTTIYSGIMYSIEQMLEYMIEYSDNKSYYVLSKYLKDINPSKDLLKDTYIDLGIIDPKDLLDQTISVKSYASMFVQLYHSSFLETKEYSEKALKILSKADWNDGLVAGLPKGIRVAHKFGERYGFDNNLKQLHDCGIIYYPRNPYLLCVMTQGYDFKELSEIIAHISKITYEEFDSRKL